MWCSLLGGTGLLPVPPKAAPNTAPNLVNQVLSAFLPQEKMEKEKRSTYAKRSISHIKRRPVKVADINIYKINYFTESQAVYKIPCRPPEKEGQPNEQVRVNLLGGSHYPDYANKSGY
jgi:hypothetical protein